MVAGKVLSAWNKKQFALIAGHPIGYEDEKNGYFAHDTQAENGTQSQSLYSISL